MSGVWRLRDVFVNVHDTALLQQYLTVGQRSRVCV